MSVLNIKNGVNCTDVLPIAISCYIPQLTLRCCCCSPAGWASQLAGLIATDNRSDTQPGSNSNVYTRVHVPRPTVYRDFSCLENNAPRRAVTTGVRSAGYLDAQASKLSYSFSRYSLPYTDFVFSSREFQISVLCAARSSGLVDAKKI